MQSDWINDCSKYISYVSSLDNAMREGYTIDRINNNGNYEIGNLRWATYHTQATNRAIPSNNKTGYMGISFRGKECKFRAVLTVNKKQIHIGYYSSIDDAIKARDSYARENMLEEYIHDRRE